MMTDDFTPISVFLNAYAPEPALETPEAAFHPTVAMTAEEVAAECERLRLLVGRQAHVNAAISAPCAAGTLSVIIYPYGLTGAERRYFWAANWPEAFRRAREWAEGHAAGVRP